MSHDLPIWVAYFQGLGPTIATIVVAGFTIWIGCRQVQIAKYQSQIAAQQAEFTREKLKHDMYDRRYAIYLAFANLIRVFSGQEGLGKQKDVALKANFALHQSQFILDESVWKYLLDLDALAWRRLNGQNPEILRVRQYANPEERSQYMRQHQEDSTTLLSAPQMLANKFMPFLKLKDFHDYKPRL